MFVLNVSEDLVMSRMPEVVGQQAMPVTSQMPETVEQALSMALGQVAPVTEVQEIQPQTVTESSQLAPAYVSNGPGPALGTGCENGGFLHPPPAHIRSYYPGHRSRVNMVRVCCLCMHKRVHLYVFLYTRNITLLIDL